MVRKCSLLWIVLSLLLAASWVAADTETPTPQAVLPESIFEFAPVVEGTEIVHAFVLQNRGEATLDVLKLTTG